MTARLLALAWLLAAAPAGAQPLSSGSATIPRHAVSGGGEPSTGAGLALNAASAQVDVDTHSGTGFRFYAGLMHLAAQPGSVTSITAVSKTTGTLELAWSAPGLDGFIGEVTDGSYRIDASSDPLHAFAPTAFLVEFATAVLPGAAQTYTLTGLEPNTTYFSRIYLADSRRFVAETSTRSEESTLTNLPASPSLSGVYASSVTFSWLLADGGAEGFRLDSSSTNFGAARPGGAVLSSGTENGLALTLTVTGLSPATTYYFRLGSLNWQRDINFDTVIATCTLPVRVLPVEGLALSGDGRARTVLLSWANPAFPDAAGVMVLVSTNPISAAVASGSSYPVGNVFADGAVVRSSAAAVSYLETGLELDATTYFNLYSKNTSDTYSVAVSTYAVLDLPPGAPAGLVSRMSVDRSSITLSWAPVTSNLDGSSFRAPSAPTSWELEGYDVYRATGIVRCDWVWVGSAAATAADYTAAVPDPEAVSFYKVSARDGFDRSLSDSSMVVDDSGSLYVVGPDQVSRLKLTPELAGALRPPGNPSGKAILIRARERPEDIAGKVVKSVVFEPLISPTLEPLPLLHFSKPDAETILHYDVADGRIAATGLGAPARTAALEPAINAAEASRRLGLYWFNGQEYVKLYGRVDSLEQTVRVRSAMAGAYQIRSIARPAGFGFDVSGISNKALTPNGDGLNDTVVFTFDNPSDSFCSGKIHDLRGAFVADMRPGPVAGASLLWDGKANGRVVPSGAYIYQIQAEGKTFTGTVLVIR